MKLSLIKKLLLTSVCLVSLCLNTTAQSFTENFDDITLLPGNGWVMTNNSTPIGSNPNWFQGNNIASGGPFDSYNGAPNSYIAANFNMVAGNNTISSWLITPNRTFRNGDVITFYTRKATPDTYPDRLEVRLSTSGASTNVGAPGNNVGDFTTLLMSINPTLITGVYPTSWTLYTVTISGLPAPTSGRIAFRYFVTSGGPLGANSDYIGIDNVVYAPYVCPTLTMNTGGALTSGTAGSSYNYNLTQSGALGIPAFTVTSGSLPPGLILASNGTISGTPTATGTFNFGVTVNDASGCSGSENYSIQIVCPPNPISLNGLPTLCSNDSPYTLIEGLPAGGIYSGAGVSAGIFDPTAGSQVITYDYTDPYGCAHTANAAITVNTNPSVTHDPISAVCANEAPFTVTGGLPVGGLYSGIGITGDVFDPLAGTQPINYEYTDGNGCTGVTSFTITVNDIPVVSHAAVTPICENVAPFQLIGGTPSGGIYSGIGITGDEFDPSAGTQTIDYEYTDGNGCSGTASVTIIVNELPNVQLSLTENVVCIGGNPIQLAGGSPSGGIYSGVGVSGGMFNPSSAGEGNVIITYNFTDANGCSASATDNFLVESCTGLSELSIQDIQVYPNPGTGVFYFQSEFNVLNCQLIDMQGKLIDVPFSEKAIDLSFAETGMYFIHFTTEQGVSVVRVIKN